MRRYLTGKRVKSKRRNAYNMTLNPYTKMDEYGEALNRANGIIGQQAIEMSALDKRCTSAEAEVVILMDIVRKAAEGHECWRSCKEILSRISAYYNSLTVIERDKLKSLIAALQKIQTMGAPRLGYETDWSYSIAGEALDSFNGKL